MRLVSDDEVERWRPERLRSSDPIERLVGGEDHEERVVLSRRPLFSQLDVIGDHARVGRGRQCEVVDVDVLRALRDLCVRADRHRMQWSRRIGGPRAEALGEQ